MMNLFVLSSEVISNGAIQFVLLRSLFCCNTKPVEDDGQETMTVFVDVERMLNNGEPGAWTAKMAKNPPVSE